jgi:signal peptidase
MTGTINYGSVTYERVVPVGDLRVGDIITYQPPPGSGIDHQVTHRIVAINGDVFRTKGDAVPQRDPWKFKLTSDRQARVVFAVPYLGYPLIWLADRGTRMLVIGLPAALIGLMAAAQLVGALRRKPEGRPEDETVPEAKATVPQHPSVPLHG